MKEQILRLFPLTLKQAIDEHVVGRWQTLQEIRLRLNQPIELIFDSDVQWLDSSFFTQKDSQFVLSQLSEFSLYRLQDELRAGYLTIEGGHRVGLAGEINTVNGQVKTLKHVTFFNIRLAKEKIDLAHPLMAYIYHHNYLNTLLIGAPQTGKTTLIRDLTRIIATGYRNIPAKKVCVIDERSEIAAAKNGIPQHNVGLRTDVLDACPKAEGMMMVIRSMSPDVIVVDEIGSADDVQALLEAAQAGVAIICTIHGSSLTQVQQRPALQQLFEQNIFERSIVLKSNKRSSIAAIYNEVGKNIYGGQNQWII